MQIYQRKRLVVLLIIFLISASFALWISVKQQSDSNFKNENMNIGLSDTAEVNQILIEKPDKQKLSIVYDPLNRQWILNDRYKVREQLINYLKFGLQKLEVKRPLPKSEEKTVDGLMHSGATFCRITSLKSEKSFYIMTNPNDLNSSYYRQKKNDQVYIVYVPGVKGNLSNLLNLNVNDWRSRDIFNSSPESLVDIQVDYKNRKEEGFEILNKNGIYSIKNLENLDTVKLKKYVTVFSYLNADRFEPLSSFKKTDFEKTPDITIKVTDADTAKSNLLKIYFMKDSNKMIGRTEKEKDVMVLNPQVFKFVLVNKDYFIRKKSTGL